MHIGLYIHVPFCTARCHFCAFYLQIHREDRAKAYLDALAREIALHASRNSLAGRTLDTIYFGGGTPTTLGPDQLAGILALARDRFGVTPGAEVTVEASPDTVTAEGLSRLVGAGVNRISFGVQSMEAEELVRVGRRSVPEQTRTAVAMARAAGIANLNLDLIYGLPGQTLESWLATLNETLALEPTHLALYALTIEDRTSLQVEVHRGTGREPDPDLQNTMEEEAARRLAAAGFERYEISNFCRPGSACRHNLLYWQDGDYLGVGPSAQSYLDCCRFGNVDDLAAYRRTLNSGALPIVETERLCDKRRRREALIFGLRLTEGVPLHKALTGDGMQVLEPVLSKLIAQGLLEQHTGWIRLTDRGRRFADSVSEALL